MCRVRSVLFLLLALVIGLAQAHTWDFAISVAHRLEFYTLNGTKTKTVDFNSQNISSLAYDEVHNMLLYVDKQIGNDSICGYNMNSAEYKCYTERRGRDIQSIAFDPVTESLFFTDTKERSINWFSLKPEFNNNFHGNLLIKLDDGIPTDIAVDSCRGYIYWINKNLPISTIEKARLNGSEREVVINAKYKLDLHSLAIDQQTEKMYWIMPETSDKTHLYSAFLNGKDSKEMAQFYSLSEVKKSFAEPNNLSVTKSFLIIADWCSTCNPKLVWKNHIPVVQSDVDFTPLFEVQTESFTGVTTNYKMKEQFLEKSDCSHVHNKYETNETFNIAREYEGPFCVYGTKITGQSLCKCMPGYIGERCDVSVCENYCVKGNCTFTDAGLPECSCDAGYSGERCETDACHQYCSNNGTCSLDEEDQPFCECTGEYVGERCEVLACLNNGDGDFNGGDEPVYQCGGSHKASRYYLIERNLTLTDLLDNYRKRAQQSP